MQYLLRQDSQSFDSMLAQVLRALYFPMGQGIVDFSIEKADLSSL